MIRGTIERVVRSPWRTGGQLRTLALCVAVGSAACDLGVTNPGRIDDEGLDTERAIPILIVGMGADLSQVVDDIGYFMGIASRDIWHSGAFEAEFFMQEGVIRAEDVNGLWADMHRARWVAEDGIRRIEEILDAGASSNPDYAEAHIWAGYANRVLGENVCQAVIDGGAAQDKATHFQRAADHFTRAIELAQSQGETELLERAYAGRAQVLLAQGQHGAAASDAGRIPDDFVFQALFSDNSSREWNWLANQSHIRRYFTVYGTWAAEVTDDPRVVWEDEGVLGIDGLSPFIRQDKYPSWNSDMDLAAGDEMRLIEAEALLRSGDVSGAMTKVNAVRQAAGVAPVTATTDDEAWAALHQERRIVLWMEGRHLFDSVRLSDPVLNGRDTCIPISQNEVATNPNVS